MVHQGARRPDFGLIGYGRFGAFAAGHLAARASVCAWDLRWGAGAEGPAPVSGPEPESSRQVRAASLAETARARVVILAVPIGAIPDALDRIRPHLTPPTLVADTASVKVWPCRWLLEFLPAIEACGTHPLFGPDSAAGGLSGHKVAFVPLRLRRPRRVRSFLEAMGLKVITTTAEEHDRAMAETQSLVHWIGRALERVEARPRDLDTLGYRRLLEILEYVVKDSLELFADLQRWNPYSAASRAALLRALEELDRALTPAPEPPPTR